FLLSLCGRRRGLPPFPTRRSSDLLLGAGEVVGGRVERALELAARVAGVDVGDERGRELDLVERVEAGVEDERGPPLARVADGVVDRKSTRLNSSHVKISYAVFCLK